MISTENLQAYGAIQKSFKKGDFLFHKGESARYYYKIVRGEVKMNNYNDNGKEFIQGIFSERESFGEPPLFIEEVYPANAEISKDAEILLLSKSKFLDLLKEKPEICLKMTGIFAKRLFYKAMIAVEMSSETPRHRVLSLLDYFKKQSDATPNNQGEIKFNLTRQEIANLTGLRVETVIRAVKTLESEGEIHIVNRKIYR